MKLHDDEFSTLSPASANMNSLLGLRGSEMGLDDPFPIDRCSGRVRSAILMEFQGRCPTIREVASISDAKWLTVPNIGPTTLEELRSFTMQKPRSDEPVVMPVMEDTELLMRISRLQRELNVVIEEIRARINPMAERRGYRRRYEVP